MFDFLFRRPAADDEQAIETFIPSAPVLTKAKPKKLNIHMIGNPTLISRSTPPPSIDDLDFATSLWQHPHPSPTRAGPSQVAWLSHDGGDAEASDDEDSQRPPSPPTEVPVHNPTYLHPMSRSASYPSSFSSDTSSSATPTPKWNLKLQTNPNYSRSTHSLRLDSRHSSYMDDPSGYAPVYPLVKQLSPIVEQDYFSPESLRRTNPLPPASDHDASASIIYSHTTLSPNGSQNSDITRPSPSYSHPFISRPLNRTNSQTSSRTHLSTTSTITPPVIPPLDLRPPFPGPHPSNGNGPSLRPPKSATTPTMPTITGSSEDYGEEYGGSSGADFRYSLHADSFVTATDTSPPETHGPPMDMDITEVPLENPFDGENLNPFEQRSQAGRAGVPSIGNASQSVPSTSSVSSSFIHRRWERDVSLGTGIVTFPKVKKQRFAFTPACWMFWLCFFCPPLWFVGGWYITIFAEAYTFRDPDEDWHWWGVKKRLARKHKQGEPPLPQWVREKQVSDGASSRQRALRGISFLYPFIARPVDPPRPRGWFTEHVLGVLRVLGKANRLLDKIPLIELRDVAGETETDRRMFDPWIQRCRYAWCWFFIFWCCIGVPGLFIIRRYCDTCLRGLS